MATISKFWKSKKKTLQHCYILLHNYVQSDNLFRRPLLLNGRLRVRVKKCIHLSNTKQVFCNKLEIFKFRIMQLYTMS